VARQASETGGLPKPGSFSKEEEAELAKMEAEEKAQSESKSEIELLRAEVAALKAKAENKPLKKVVPPKKEWKPIMVVATDKGFYKNVRKSAGDKFEIPDKFFLGRWMKPV